MQDLSLSERCLGTVVVHRYDAVTCTRDTCPRDLPLESWFSHHTSFMTCLNKDCPHCGSGASVQLATGDRSRTTSIAARRRERLLDAARRRHPSS